MFGAVLFDCDGVLVDSEILAVEVETAMLAEWGLAYEPDLFKTRFMGMSDDAFYAELNADSLKQLDRPLPDGFQADCTARLYHAVAERLVEVEGARRAVELVTRPKAVVSSSTREKLGIKLKKAGLFELFAPHIYSSDDVRRAKPAPDLFLHAAAAMGIHARDCLVIEDSVNGIRAARAAGMRVWGFGGGGHMDNAGCARLVGAGAERLVFTWEETTALFASA
jgi:HAD superfamily hydrolase (TIGR01509 family)